MNLKEKVKELPSSPGVYLMKDSLNNIIYVGKSKNLKNRVGSYFINSKSHSPKIIKLVQNLKDFEYRTTDTEFEAFLLECELIKEIKPAYNRLMKNPKSYSYIKIILNENFPSIETSHESSKTDGNIYFGPYSRRNLVERGIYGLKEYFKILCNNNSKNSSSCINHSLGLCIGMCFNHSALEEYLNILNKIVKLLSGTDNSILDEMECIMKNSSEKFDFENAAKYRDYINAVNYLIDRINVVKFTENNANIALLEYLDNNSFKFFLIKGNNMLFKKKYFIKDADSKDLKSLLINEVVRCFNHENINYPIDIGKEEIDQSQIIYTYLKSKTNDCNYAVISDKLLNSPGNIDNVIANLLSFH
ncbi:GIY-YIG nuclease family protein [Clostridium chromiireducens]|uniref:UvrABC system protein C n=1 Tax=Clostridium chromiireducens TaxID=225345 RepID=A0A1V4IT63_9CLOT|nr:GIY-YIG nuclease family protein [Clostridium chromiireducens]OPJ62985.1 UvrABC system protein C [Clostridium chromiireducens]